VKKAYLILIIIILLLVNAFQFAWKIFAYRLPWYAIPTEEAALEVGKALLVSVYGEGVLDSAPFEVSYDKKRKAWIICGTLPEGYVGNTPGIIFRKHDGKIIKIDNSM